MHKFKSGTEKRASIKNFKINCCSWHKLWQKKEQIKAKTPFTFKIAWLKQLKMLKTLKYPRKHENTKKCFISIHFSLFQL